MPAGCDTTGIDSVTGSASGDDEAQAVVADGVVVVAARDEHHLVPVLRQPAAHHPADRAGAVHHESHAPQPRTRGPLGHERAQDSMSSIGSVEIPAGEAAERVGRTRRATVPPPSRASSATVPPWSVGDLRHDRQPEPGAGQRARAGRAVEAVEHPGAVVGGDAGAAVGDLDRRRRARSRRPRRRPG